MKYKASTNSAEEQRTDILQVKKKFLSSKARIERDG